MALKSFAQIGKAVADEGKIHYSYLYKAITPAPATQGFFVDLNQSAGTPKYNAFQGSQLTATQLVGSGNFGLNTGPSVSGSTKHLLRMQMTQLTSTNGPPDYVYMCDYLMFYPLIDCDDDSPQVMDNPVTLPRYETGEGVRAVLIVTAPIALTAAITLNYTNSEGVSGRTSTFNLIPGANIGVCATGSGTLGEAGQVTPFFPLASGDTGMRSIESVTLGAQAGGFITIALVKPIAQIPIYEASVASEKLFGIENQMLPEIKDGACLNFLIQRGGTAAGAYRGEFLFINS